MSEKTNGKAKVNGKANGAATVEKAKRERRAFWDQTWQAPRVKAALEKMGVKPEDFEKAYNSLPSSGRQGPTEAEIKAVRSFKSHRDFTRLQKELGVKTPDAVGRAMARVEQHLASATA